MLTETTTPAALLRFVDLSKGHAGQCITDRSWIRGVGFQPTSSSTTGWKPVPRFKDDRLEASLTWRSLRSPAFLKSRASDSPGFYSRGDRSPRHGSVRAGSRVAGWLSRRRLPPLPPSTMRDVTVESSLALTGIPALA